MVVTYAGRRAQSIGANLDAARRRIRVLLTALAPRAIVGALADGADLLVVETALATTPSPAVHVVLPTTEPVFRDDSVAEDWRDRFAAALAAVRARGGTVRSLGLPAGEDAYRQANSAFLDEAITLAGDAERAVALLVAGDGEGATVTHLAECAAVWHVPVLRIDPGVAIEGRPSVFVAMPYGSKLDPQRRVEVDCDLVYRKVLQPALEHAQLCYRREDMRIDSGVVLQPMIEALATADLVIGDLQTQNFNVGWELGLRHLMRPRQTLLIGPQGSSPPFDLSMVRHVVYRQDEHGITDDAAIEAWDALAPYLAGVGDTGGPSDSPVDAVMEVEQWGVVRRRAAPDPRFATARQRLALALQLADADLVLEALAEAEGVDDTSRRLLGAQAGAGLVHLGRYADARRLLADVVDDDHDVRRPEAHVSYALALYRDADADVAAYDAAERVLKRVLLARPAYPETRALLGAIAKRRIRLRKTAAEREHDLRLAMDAYQHDYEQDLNRHYEGINVVAAGVALHLGYGDTAAGQSARELLPAVRVAAMLVQRANPRDYWAAATLAECALYERLLGLAGPPVGDANRAAGALHPARGDLDSTLAQLDLLALLGLPQDALDEARAGLLSGAGA